MAICVLLGWGRPAGAETAKGVPHVVADIAPVHALVAAVMKGVGDTQAAPDVLIGPEMSPHAANLRPSAARTLSRADLVIWIGPMLAPWLEDAITSLAPDAQSLLLLHAEGTHRLSARDGGHFTAHHDHGGHEDEGDTHGTEDHAADGAEDLDPHAWLDPENAMVWVDLIAQTLADLDPDNAETYRENAARMTADLRALMTEIDGILTPAKGLSYVVYHDAFQYFGNRFDLPALAAVSDGHAHAPGARRIRDLRTELAAADVDCVVTEPQFDSRLLSTVAGEDIPLAELDPLGTDLPPGPSLYPESLRAIARALATCAETRDPAK